MSGRATIDPDSNLGIGDLKVGMSVNDLRKLLADPDLPGNATLYTGRLIDGATLKVFHPDKFPDGELLGIIESGD